MPLTFVRVQPYVSPKIELSDQRQERVDVRVLPVLFEFTPPPHVAVYPASWSMCTSGSSSMCRNTPWMPAVVVAGLLAGAGCAVGPRYVKPPVVDLAITKNWPRRQQTMPGGWRIRATNPPGPVVDGVRRCPPQYPRRASQRLQPERRGGDSQLPVGAGAGAPAQSQLFPGVTTAPSVAATRTPVPIAGDVLPFDASWQADLWGKLRNAVKANVSSAQASAADLENVRLTMQAEVAADYYQLRAQDALGQLLDETVAAYRDSLRIAQVQFQTGLTSDETVAQAETQLQATDAQAANLGILRAQYQHTIALLVGQPATSFTVTAEVVALVPPPIPVGVPSQLVERRPDIAAAERRMAQAMPKSASPPRHSFRWRR